MDRREVRRELRLLEVAGGNILVRSDDLPPRPEPGLGLRFDDGGALLDPVAGALLEHGPHVFLLHRVHGGRLAGGADGGQQ